MKKHPIHHEIVCDNCGKNIHHDSMAVTTEVRQTLLTFCSEQCDAERRANIALREMTWGNAS
ncbi:hypothetical protein NAI64_02535 [Oxalobacter sp. OxGP1]|uniref:hypothetical protein n=1 Tax=Oxalobacter paeniformigenes TaxID=2946594 RepID=UPI0022AEC904|nr:hypothetical protein [Oxalobacter paeniformigenes]MCZ4052600.1 hypothetical protein [Oxalobacter paeniformigenes]